ncbi:Co2+/Mg2+ efflux protein ApaG [Uliginosibacterium flavum]|uniref:Protein ApaG n=1 Tax=Uliginosibacterium flavum TaxID=1396831 RepID=A0ABV2TGY6_9RHOO
MNEPKPPRAIKVDAIARYVPEQSAPDEKRHVFAYQITITNIGTQAAKLLGRHWYITDGNGDLDEVQGEGVVGEQPLLAPGESFEYTSGCALATPFGSMRGSYLFRDAEGVEFETDIPEFFLVGPRVLH